MRRQLRNRVLMAPVLMAAALAAPRAQAAEPTVADALKFRPVQKNVDYDIPAADKAEKCTLKPEKIGEVTGWVVRDDQGQLLRRFIDTNKDNAVDMWCYYQDGLEVYRDVDSNHNTKADQCRWLNLGGTRWGIDENEDGAIDTWQVISPEEVSAELVQAIGARDTAAFKRLLLTEQELADLGLGEERQKQIADRLTAAVDKFEKTAAEQKIVTPKTHWASFGAIRPGLVPAESAGSTKDLLVYENVVAMVDNEKAPAQVLIGTLIKVGDVWRAIDAPLPLGQGDDEVAAAYLFFDPGLGARNDLAQGGETGGPSAEMQKLLNELEELDKQGGQEGGFDERRAELLAELAAKADKPEDRAGWVRQLADMVSAAAQSGEYADGVTRLQELFQQYSADEATKELAGYIKFRLLSAQYTASLQDPKADYAAIQAEWLKNLEQFVTDFPQSSDAAEALLQLAIAQEFAGQEDEAKTWYQKIVDGFPEAAPAKKAAGAIARLNSVGKGILMTGKATNGQMIDLSKLRGRVVLLHYWATWCEPCKADLANIKDLANRYGAQGFVPVGICLDATPETVSEYLKQNPLNWPQIYEPGGLDGRLANELGILTLPTMLLIDPQGRVANRNIHVTELEKELKALLPKTAPPKGVAADQPQQPQANPQNAASSRPGGPRPNPRQAESQPGPGTGSGRRPR